MRNLIFLTTLIFLLIGCKSATEKVKEDFLPIARGEADEIILVMDSAQWAGQLGDAMRGVYQQYMRVLNQDEYEFSLSRVNPTKLNSVFLNARNLIFVMTLSSKTRQSKEVRDYFTDNSLKMIQRDSSIYYTVRKDEFAKGQTVLYLFGQTEEQLLDKINNNQDALKELFLNAMKDRLREVVLAKTKTSLMKSVTESHGYSIDIPFGYDLAKDVKDFVWLRKLEKNSEFNVFIHEQPYKDELFYQKIDEVRDGITTTYLRDSEKPDIFIARQQIVPTQTKRINFNGKFAVEARGLWKISDISGGGPYVSYTFVDEANQKLYYIEGYVYSPGTKKKHLIREVETILSTFKTPSEQPTNAVE